MIPHLRIFCDMDGVLCNFDDAFAKLNAEGLKPTDYTTKYGKGSVWPMISEAGSKFWSEMEWMPDGQKLWEELFKYEPTILSSPSRDYSSIAGKMKWIHTNLGINQEKPVTKNKDWDKDTRIILSQHKHLYVVPDTICILIDDTISKVEKWADAGGIAILHTDTESTLDTLNSILHNFN